MSFHALLFDPLGVLKGLILTDTNEQTLKEPLPFRFLCASANSTMKCARMLSEETPAI